MTRSHEQRNWHDPSSPFSDLRPSIARYGSAFLGALGKLNCDFHATKSERWKKKKRNLFPGAYGFDLILTRPCLLSTAVSTTRSPKMCLEHGYAELLLFLDTTLARRTSSTNWKIASNSHLAVKKPFKRSESDILLLSDSCAHRST